MKLGFYIARRYFFAQRKLNASNIITLISIVGFTFGSAALITVLSAFNGFEVLVDSLYHSFYPDIKVNPKMGKVFEPDTAKMRAIRHYPEVHFASEVLEENVLLKYDQKQNIATIKGVNREYPRMVKMDSLVVQGEPLLEEGERDFAIVGGGIAYKLSVNPFNRMAPLHVYIPKRGANPILRPDLAFTEGRILPSGIFVLEESIDNKYVFVPLRFARDMLDQPTKISSFEISLRNEDHMDEVQQKIETLLGPDFHVQNRYQQNEVLYRIMKSEKIAVYLILTFILLIAAFNVTGSLYMLVIEKKEDIKVLRAMGASENLIRWIFTAEGMIVTVIGSGTGILLGGIFCWLQQTYGLIKIGSVENSTLLLEAYPVKMNPGDFVLVFVTGLAIGYITSWYPASKAARLGYDKQLA